MNEIRTQPTPKDFGLEFNYSLWTPETRLLLTNVPWNSDYRDAVYFEGGQNGLDRYLEEKPGGKIKIEKLSIARAGLPIRIDVPFADVYRYNYIRARNGLTQQGGDGQTYYYFINDVRYIAPNTTEIIVQLDAWQTFIYKMEFGACFIERGHVGIANELQMEAYGQRFLTVPEGLDIGNEYVIAKQFQLDVASGRKKFNDGDEVNYNILVATTVALNEDYGTVEAPKLHTARGSSMGDLPNGCELYVFNGLTHFKDFMAYVSDKPWISQGIISIMAIPPVARYDITSKTTFMGPNEIPVREIESGIPKTKQTRLAENWRDQMTYGPGGRYNHLHKFKTFPYTVIEMTSYTGTPLVLKPECWNDPNATVMELAHLAPPSPRLAFYPFRYNASGAPNEFDDHGVINDGGEFLDMQTGIFNFPTFSVVNDSYIQFMASNVNNIAYQHSSADWSQQKALQGNSTAYDQASAAMDLSRDLSRQGINATQRHSQLHNEMAMLNGLNNGLQGAISQGRNGLAAAGAIAQAAIGTGLSIHQNNMATGINTDLARGTNNSQVNNMAYMRDTNRNLADWAANGDYAQAIAGINARVQDARLTQPTTAGQMGGDSFLLGQYKWGVDLKVKTLQPGVMAVLGEFWLRYGYAVNNFGYLPRDFHVMNKFSYWKLRETYILHAPCPEMFKQAIRGIFEKGVTVWKNPDDMGRTDFATNRPLSGVRL